MNLTPLQDWESNTQLTPNFLGLTHPGCNDLACTIGYQLESCTGQIIEHVSVLARTSSCHARCIHYSVVQTYTQVQFPGLKWIPSSGTRELETAHAHTRSYACLLQVCWNLPTGRDWGWWCSRGMILISLQCSRSVIISMCEHLSNPERIV